MPAAQRLRRVGVDMTLQLAIAIADVPDHALQRLQRRCLAILGDPPFEDIGGFLDRQIMTDDRFDIGHDLLHGVVAGLLAQEAPQMLSRVGKQRLVDEVDRRGGAFDRSEEHTSELQSLMRTSYAVFCLKKKIITKKKNK